MIVTTHVIIKLAPKRVYDHFKSLGYSGFYGDPVLVKVQDLLPKSMAAVACVCDVCQRSYEQRYARNTQTCPGCRAHRFEKGNIAGKKNDLHLIPARETLLADLERGQSKKHLVDKYGINYIVLDRWLRERNIGLIPYQYQYREPPERAVLEIANETMTLADMCREFKTCASVIKRWLDSFGIQYIVKRWESKEEEELAEWLQEEFGGFIRNKRGLMKLSQETNPSLSQMEIDVFHPEKRLGIEYDGLFWYSSLFRDDSGSHYKKFKAAEDAGIRLIRITSSEWKKKKEMVQSLIRAKMGTCEKIGARKLTACEVSGKEARAFHDRTHIAGSIATSSVHIGLRGPSGTLLSCMSFGKSRLSKDAEWEVLRFSSELGVAVVGGAGKIFSAFVEGRSPASVVSFADLRLGTGAVYEKIGFERVSRTKPNYWYLHEEDPETLFSRIKFQKHKLSGLLSVFDPALSEWENMRANGYHRYWDCGSDKFIWRP